MKHKSAYQVSASQLSMVANDDGSKSGVFYVVKEFFVHLKVKLKVSINAHGKKKLEPNQDDASGHFLSAKSLHTRPASCSTRARLVATGAIRLRYTVKT